ncbi:hypothetical protein B0A50_00643 [Salinomyces thailandicus]|uniref:HTH La-type RNA-binding domain-containing protein n=1 Tax=Salinomyces thailandicus TaxID=706561 RepID=A0A4U0UGL4_9PEZI|nr:hypothetical protein B0A50_00643 [Salinomyces thailandica]
MSTAATHSLGSAANVGDSPPPITVSTWTPSSEVEETCPVQPARYHSQAAEILRQVEYYFSDDNLPSDAHLLGFTGRDGTNPVSISLVMSFRKMRGFKPKSVVREVLRSSSLVEVVDAHHIRRRFPLTRPLLVPPRIDEARLKTEIALATNPNLSKNMLKPTGFEADAVEAPLTDKERSLYNPEINFIGRIQTAVNYFASKRKMHQNLLAVFTKFLLFGGFSGGANMFQGGMSQQELKKKEGLTDAEIRERLQYYGVSGQVQQAIYAQAEDQGRPAIFVVDFEAMAKAFLSSEFMATSQWYDEKVVKTGVQVLRSFYKYLLVHNVCPEYEHQLHAACSVCDQAEEELPKLATVDKRLPGSFNAACSTLFNGSYASLHLDASSASQDNNDGGWILRADSIGISKHDAKLVFCAGLASYGTDEQYEKANAAFDKRGQQISTVSAETLGLEVIRIEMPTEEVKNMYEELNSNEQDSHQLSCIQPMGKLICKRWRIPYAAPTDLPKHLLSSPAADEEFTFIVEAEVLAFCYPGIRLDCCIKVLDLGIAWIESVDAIFPSFYLWLPNEQVCGKDAWKEPGPPKAWMKRQLEKKSGRDVSAPKEVDKGVGDSDGDEDGGEGSDEGNDGAASGFENFQGDGIVYEGEGFQSGSRVYGSEDEDEDESDYDSAEEDE